MYFVRHALPRGHPALQRGSVVTIGAFDGLHLGHQAILDRVRDVAVGRGLVSVLMSFEPTPKEFFSPREAPARLMRFREKYLALAELGIDVFFCPRFDRSMAAVEPHPFAETLLTKTLAARHIVIGDDFRYARQRSGTVEVLRESGKRLGFEVEQVTSVVKHGSRVSSTIIRDALQRGDLRRAESLLGRPYSMSGRVIEGKRLGRTLGYPTANIAIHRRESPVQGIFAVRLRGIDQRVYDGVASIGTRPTLDNGNVLLEVHVFDFDAEIYGAYVNVEFLARLRDEEKFETVEALVRQMQRDAENARRILAESIAE